MRNRNDAYLKHYGIIGMRWGHRKSPDEGNGSSHSSNPKLSEVARINKALLKKNQNAAVFDWSSISDDLSGAKLTSEQRAARNKKLKKIAIGVGLGLGIAAGAFLYAKNKNAVDTAVKGFLEKNGLKKVSELQTPEQIQAKQIKNLAKAGFNVKTPQDVVRLNWVAAWMGHDMNRYNTISNEKYSSLDDNDVSIKAGEMLHRVSRKASMAVHKGAYVSYGEDDANRYNAFMPALWKANPMAAMLLGSPDPHVMKLEALTELKSPSAKKRIDIFASLIERDPDFLRQANLGARPGDSAHNIARKNYYKFAANLIDRDNHAANKYKSELMRLGYNVLIDDNDAGRLSKNPLILLDPDRSVKLSSVTKLTNKVISESLSKVQPMEGESYEKTFQVLRQNIFAKAAIKKLDEMMTDIDE